MPLEFNVVVVGSGGVGKSCLTVRLTAGTYDDSYNPTIEEQYEKELTIGAEKIKLNILDTAGQEEYAVLQNNYWRSGDGFLIVFDVTSRISFKQVTTYYDSIVKAKEYDVLPIVLCANKSDLPRSSWQVTEEEIMKLAKEKSFAHMLTSAKANSNVKESFEELAKRIVKFRKIIEEGDDTGSSSHSPSEERPLSKKSFSLKNMFRRKK